MTLALGGLAVEWGVIQEMPCQVPLVRAPRSEAKFHDFEDFDALVRAAEADGPLALAAVLFGGQAGLRCGEMMALEWGSVDFGRSQLAISHAQWKGHRTATKGEKVRYVDMTDELKMHLGRLPRSAGGGRVLLNASGKSLTQKVVQNLVKHGSKRAGVSHGVHILRHTFCSHLAMRGVAVPVIQKLAGHKDIATTMRYIHLAPKATSDAIRALERPGFGGMMEAAGT